MSEDSEKFDKNTRNKITECLDEMTEADNYEARYHILREFSLASYKAGSVMALDAMGEELKKVFGVEVTP